MLCWYLNWKHVHSIGFLSGVNGFASIHSRPLLISQARARTIGSMICSLQNAPPAQCTLTFHNRPKVIRTRAARSLGYFLSEFVSLPTCLLACLLGGCLLAGPYLRDISALVRFFTRRVFVFWAAFDIVLGAVPQLTNADENGASVLLRP